MRKSIFVFLMCIALFISHVKESVSAPETILFFAPMRVELSEANPVQEIRVTNMSNTSRAYSMEAENIVMNTSGVTERVDNFDFSAKRSIRFVPHQFSIKPGERQIIRVMARFTPDMQDGEYHVHLNFLENLSKSQALNKSEETADNKAKAQAQIAYSTSIPVIVSKGTIKTEIAMKDMKLSYDKQKHPTVSMNLTRLGNGQGNALLEGYYTGPDGKEVMAGVRRTASIYREIDQRAYDFTFELLDREKVQKGGKLTIKLFNKNVSQDKPVDTISIPVE